MRFELDRPISISPAFIKAAAETQLSREERLFGLLLMTGIPHAGSVRATAKTFAAVLFPWDEEVTSQVARESIDALARAGWIQADWNDGSGTLTLTDAGRRLMRPKRPSISRLQRALVYKRDHHTCQHCLTKTNLTVDHIEALMRGGEHHTDNMQTLCRPCNSRKGARY